MGDTYEERVNRFQTTINHQEPDKVPILSMIGTYAIQYAGGTVQEMAEQKRKKLNIIVLLMKKCTQTQRIPWA